MTGEYDSRADTETHIRRVREIIGYAQECLSRRALDHDASKLESPEKEILDVMTPRLRGVTYGSDEYRAMMVEMRPMIKHHNAHNSHHPEHYGWHCALCMGSYSDATAKANSVECPDLVDRYFCPRCVPRGGSIIHEAQLYHSADTSGISGMSLLDLLEMLCDWRAATERHADGNILKSLTINRERFFIGDQLYAVLENTAREMGWIERGAP